MQNPQIQNDIAHFSCKCPERIWTSHIPGIHQIDVRLNNDKKTIDYVLARSFLENFLILNILVGWPFARKQKAIMKKIIFLFFTSLLSALAGLAQYPYGLMPGLVFGVVDDDTLLNTRKVLLNSGIKKIHAYQTSSESLKTHDSKTTVINESGNVESITACFSKNKDNKETWCVFDTFLYDDRGRIREMKSRDRNGYEVTQTILEYIGDKEYKLISISKMPNKQWDTLSDDHRYFNTKEQMIKLVRTIKGRSPETSLYHYNADGLLDSVQYENPHLPTIVYKRSEKGKKKIIAAQIQNSKFKWVFNQSGQCESTQITTTHPPQSNYTGSLKSESNYYYNPDGTLLKVSLKTSDKVKATMHYTYSK